MPIYCYACSACGLQQDVMQKISDVPLTTCPECGKETFAKKLTAAAFQLKGNGYYVTDFKNAPKKPDIKPVTNAETASAPSGNTAQASTTGNA